MDTYLIFFIAIFSLKIITLLLQQTRPIMIETMKSAFNYGEPGSTENISSEMIKTYKIEYPKRPSLTGIYTESGPLGANIGCYDSQTQGCNSVPNSKS